MFLSLHFRDRVSYSFCNYAKDFTLKAVCIMHRSKKFHYIYVLFIKAFLPLLFFLSDKSTGTEVWRTYIDPSSYPFSN